MVSLHMCIFYWPVGGNKLQLGSKLLLKTDCFPFHKDISFGQQLTEWLRRIEVHLGITIYKCSRMYSSV